MFALVEVMKFQQIFIWLENEDPRVTKHNRKRALSGTNAKGAVTGNNGPPQGACEERNATVAALVAPLLRAKAVERFLVRRFGRLYSNFRAQRLLNCCPVTVPKLLSDMHTHTLACASIIEHKRG